MFLSSKSGCFRTWVVRQRLLYRPCVHCCTRYLDFMPTQSRSVAVYSLPGMWHIPFKRGAFRIRNGMKSAPENSSKCKQKAQAIRFAIALYSKRGISLGYQLLPPQTRIIAPKSAGILFYNHLVPGGRGVLPSKRLLGMCRWMGSHFHNWTDYNGVTFLVELLEWRRKSSGFLG